MGKFSSKARAGSVTKSKAATKNYEGGLAFEMGPEERLYSRVLTSLVGEKKFYQKGKDHDNDIVIDIKLVAERDPEFILKLAAYARNMMYLRSAPIMLLAEAANIPECKPYVRKWAPHIIKRADEPAELIGYWVSKHGDIGSNGSTPFPNSLKKGIADALKRFDEYQIEKWSRPGEVKLRDVLRICHPAPDNEIQNAIFNYIINDEMDPVLLPKLNAKQNFLRKDEFDEEARKMVEEGSLTWEVVVSRFGNSKEVWESLHLPYMAMLRNLRNMLQAGVDMKPIAKRIADPKEVRRSKQLPFRFYSAAQELAHAHQREGLFGVEPLINALQTALTLSAENIPRFPGRTLIACDNSGSMSCGISQRGTISYYEIANLIGALAHKFCDEAIVGAFATEWAPVSIRPGDSVFTNMEIIGRADTNGMSTDAWRVLDWMTEKGVEVDRIILISDMQAYDSSGFSWYSRGVRPQSVAELLQKYRSQHTNAFLHSIDLAGYGTTQTPPGDNRSNLIAGWSDRVLQYIVAFEQEKATAVQEIKAMSPEGL